MDDDRTCAGLLIAERYRLEHPLGGGAMGTVWLAEDETLKRRVALKQAWVPSDADASSLDEHRKQSLREGRIAARVRNEHAIAIYDVVLDGTDLWLVMEYLPSRTLAQVVREDHVLELQQAARVVAQVADALADAHAAGVVHQDVKPANILVGEGGDVDGMVKITDFGIAHAVGDLPEQHDEVISGTPAFFAPEVARGGRPSPASDVFALGATLYACLEGHPPFGVDDDVMALLRRVGSGEFPAPSRAGGLEPVLMRMLDPDPAARPTMTQVRDELAEVAAGRPDALAAVLAERAPLRPVDVAAAAGAGAAVGAAGYALFSGPQQGAAVLAPGATTAPAAPAAAGASGAAASPVAAAPPVAAGAGAEAAPEVAAVVTPVVAKAGGIGVLLAKPAALLVGAGVVAATVGGTYVVSRTGNETAAAAVSTSSVSSGPTSSSPSAVAAVAPTRVRDAVSRFLAQLPDGARAAFGTGGPALRAVDPGAVSAFFGAVDEVTAGPLSPQNGQVRAQVVLALSNGNRRDVAVLFTVTPATPAATAATPTKAEEVALVVDSEQLAGLVSAGLSTTTPTTAPGATPTASASPTPRTSGPSVSSVGPPSAPVSSTPGVSSTPQTATPPTSSSPPTSPTSTGPTTTGSSITVTPTVTATSPTATP
ncbi:MAG: serine/threonine-protein kinase [Mycobacteriaceae bacterium]